MATASLVLDLGDLCAESLRDACTVEGAGAVVDWVTGLRCWCFVGSERRPSRSSADSITGHTPSVWFVSRIVRTNRSVTVAHRRARIQNDIASSCCPSVTEDAETGSYILALQPILSVLSDQVASYLSVADGPFARKDYHRHRCGPPVSLTPPHPTLAHRTL